MLTAATLRYLHFLLAGRMTRLLCSRGAAWTPTRDGFCWEFNSKCGPAELFLARVFLTHARSWSGRYAAFAHVTYLLWL